MSNRVIQIENLSKLYRLGVWGTGSLRDDLNRTWSRVIGRTDPTKQLGTDNKLDSVDSQFVWALRDINLEVSQGEVVGIIGRNGAGKSTLLKILSRITGPTHGHIRMKGRVASLLEVGTGMHEELTGRENIFLNGAILGMKKHEVKTRFDEIVDFAGIAKYINTPIKRYSSGMRVRLGFAIAAFLEPEILIVDEVLAVGDADFQKKAIGKMQDVSAGEGRTVLFVSHNMASVENLCSRAVVLDKGAIACESPTSEAIQYYLQHRKLSIRKPLHERTDRRGNQKVVFRSFRMENVLEEHVSAVSAGESIFFVFDLDIRDQAQHSIDVGFSIHTSSNQTLSVLYGSYQNFFIHSNGKNSVTVKCWLDNLPFARGTYTIGGRILTDGEESDWPENGIAEIEVVNGDFYQTGKEGFEGNTAMMLKGDWAVR